MDNYEVLGNKHLVIYDKNNTGEAITITMLKKAISFAEDKQKLKAILTESKQKAKILNIAKKILSSFVGRFIFYFILIGLIPVPESFTMTNLYMIIYLLLCIIIGYIDPFKIYATILRKTDIEATVDKSTIKLKEKYNKAAQKYNENKENFNMLITLLGDNYGKIKVAKQLLLYLQSGKANTLEEAKKLYNRESKIKRDRNRKDALTIGAIALGVLTIFFTGLFILTSFAMSDSGNRNDWWW
ncbi:MAG: hypothetical protein Q4D26_12520 [Clostridia bacterium]|nr:hypothetical protein [Clostridia bacterium]